MESILSLILPLALTALLLRMLFLPIRFFAKAGLHAACGFLCLWTLNSVSHVTGLYLPINSVTVLLAGVGGMPGIGLIAALELFL